jgi:hypothetical protein
MSFIGTAVIGSAVIGGISTAYAASKASQAQTAAADKASQTALGMYNTTRGDLEPYRAIGQQASTDLSGRLDDLTAPITMDQATLEKTPGYQFNLTQGLKATQNSAAARGLGVSGAALKGAATFATGLADSTYQNQFNNANTNKTNAYNRLKGLVDVGENAGAQTGTAGTAAANTSANASIGAGNAEAAADNKIGQSIANTANGIGGYAAYKGLYGNSGGGVNTDGSISGAWGPTSVGGAPLVG